MEWKYPKRESYFACKFLRALYDSGAVEKIGHHACTLLSIIVLREDATRYKRPVAFWNGELESLMGFHSRKQLPEARQAAINAGWLQWSRPNTRQQAAYFVTIPDGLTCSENGTDQPANCSENGTNPAATCSEFGQSNAGSVPNLAPKCSENGTPPNPTPNPKPSPALNAEQEAFKKLIQDVAACGVDQAQPAVTAALAAGCTLAEVGAAIEFFRSLAGVTPGALFAKLTNMQPGDAASRRFPKPATASADRQHALRAERQFSDQAAREAASAERERAELAEIEAEHGPKLDALTKAETRNLVKQIGSSGLLFEFTRNPESAIVRAEMLKRLASAPASAAGGL